MGDKNPKIKHAYLLHIKFTVMCELISNCEINLITLPTRINGLMHIYNCLGQCVRMVMVEYIVDVVHKGI